MRIFIIIAGAILLLLWSERKAVYRFFGRTRRKHKRKIKYSKDLHTKLQDLAPAQMIKYLRKIDPLVFEELLLTAFKAQGHKIRRNKSYSGDGGLDGIVYIDKCRYLIQAKRYSGSINTKHVLEFAALVQSRRNVAGGFFIHPGRTPTAAKELFRDFTSITLISGQRLVDLIQGKIISRGV